VLDRNYVDVTQGEIVNIKVKSTTPGVRVKVKVYNLTGELIRKFEGTTGATEWTNIPWDVKNAEDRYVGRGMHFLIIKREDGKTVIKRVFVVK